MRWVIPFLLLPVQAIAADYAHCYMGEAPADAPVSSELNLSNLLPNLQIATLKTACGLSDEEDQAMLMGIVEAGGCSGESEVAGYVRKTFDISSKAARAELGGAVPDDMMESLCAVASACDPGPAGYDESCLTGVAAAVGQR